MQPEHRELQAPRVHRAFREYLVRVVKTEKIAPSQGRKERPAQRALPARLASKVLKEYRASLAPKVRMAKTV